MTNDNNELLKLLQLTFGSYLIGLKLTDSITNDLTVGVLYSSMVKLLPQFAHMLLTDHSTMLIVDRMNKLSSIVTDDNKSALLNWLLDGLQYLKTIKSQGLRITIPVAATPIAKPLTEFDLFIHSFCTSSFVRSHCKYLKMDPDRDTQAAVLHAGYLNWHNDQRINSKAMSMTAFGIAMGQRVSQLLQQKKDAESFLYRGCK